MAQIRRSADKPKKTAPGRSESPPPPPSEPPEEVGPPVKIAVLFREGAEAEALELVQKEVGRRAVVRSADLTGGALEEAAETLVALSHLGVILAEVLPAGIQNLRTLVASGGPIEQVILVEPFETTVAFQADVPTTVPTDLPSADSGWVGYVQGYCDAVNHLAEALGVGPAGRGRDAVGTGMLAHYPDDTLGTWGLHATGVLGSRYTGRGVRVAALVDGLDTSHPDWAGRKVVMRSFVAGEVPTDGGASGTHYLGTAFGTGQLSAGPRYGCAPDAELFVAKVLSRSGTASQAANFAALDWVIANSCRVILVSLGWTGTVPAIAFERMAQRVATRGGLVIAGVGNNALRPGELGSVANPAACPSVLGVGSIDNRLNLPSWTPRSSGPTGGAVDLVGPGVNLRSSVPRPGLYASWSGSATAAAYVAGIAALWAESLPVAGAHELWRALVSRARRLSLPAADVGAGLVQAP